MLRALVFKCPPVTPPAAWGISLATASSASVSSNLAMSRVMEDKGEEL